MNRKTIQEELKSNTSYIKDLHFTKCKACGSKDLLKFEVDTFCMDCDWNSVLMDVECGNFEKRIAILNRKRHQNHASIEEIQTPAVEPIQEIGA